MRCFVHEILWLAVLLSVAFCKETCRVQDGHPGEPGAPGRDGLLGQKGEKGEAAPVPWWATDVKTGVKGDRGERGFPGRMGQKGYRGENGQQGVPGHKGPAGPMGHSGGPDLLRQSGFSVERKAKQKPTNGVPVTFDTVLADINREFNPGTGHFTCKSAGVYYFVFHSMSNGNLCLALKSDALDEKGLSFCDFNMNGRTQVLSGGGVLKLARGQKVWVEPVKDEQILANFMTNTESRSIVFNGFRVFSSTD